MCVICLKNNDFDLEHVRNEIKKLRKEELGNKARAVKDAIRKYEIWSKSEHCDGFEKAILEETLYDLKQTQYLLNQHI